MSDSEKPSPVETIKGESNYLRGELTEELVRDEEKFGKASVQLLKHFGTYQQDDRDLRTQMRQEGKDKSYMFMVRTRIPGGRLTSAQLLAELDLCDELGNQTLRITTRQGLQLHGILKSNLQATIAKIDETQLTTLGACGDVNRNVMCCPAPFHNHVHESIQQLADQLADHLRPRTRAYHEIWLKQPDADEKTLVAGGPPADEVEPIYGRHYLPRKFKIGIALPHDNCIDVYTHDVGLIAVTDNGHLKGFNVLVGGGFGVTPSAKKTFPALGKPMCFVTCEQVIDVVTEIVKVQRDFGNRSDRKIARMKYLVANWGIERFKEKVEEYYGRPLPPVTDDDVHDFDDHLGWSEQGDGRLFYGLNVENGRLRDTGNVKLKSAIREVCRTLQPAIRLTAHQSLIFADIEPENKAVLEDMLRGHGVTLSQDISEVRRWSMACVAWPTCGLSITEAERCFRGWSTVSKSSWLNSAWRRSNSHSA